MTRKSKKTNPNRISGEYKIKYRQPFWQSSINYYFLTIGIAIACFFITLGILHSLEEELPIVTAGLVFGLILISAVIIREIIFKLAYKKSLAAQQRIDHNIKSVFRQNRRSDDSNRLTIDRNNSIINLIESRSKAAISLGKLGGLHLEVFELCQEYLRKSTRELESINKESPRYNSIRRGQLKIQKLHHFHLLNWASIESQNFVQNAKVQVAINDKIENAQKALATLENAIQFYPNDSNLLQSVEVIQNFVIKIKVSHWIEQGERLEFKQNYTEAISHYQDALFYLSKENENLTNKAEIEEMINVKIGLLKKKN